MQNALLVLHLIICMVLVGAVLMQRSEGGALGMGGGGGGGLISGRGAADMMVNITSWVGGAFFVTSLVLAVLANTQPADRSVIRAPGEPAGFQFTIPGLPKFEPKSSTPTAQPAPPAVQPSPAAVEAPAPEQAVIRAGPLETAPAAAPVGAAGGAERPAPPPAASLPASRPPVGSATRTPAGATPGKAPVGAPKAASPAPMIPLPKAPPPAPAAESQQAPAPAPAPEREKAGPDE